MYNSCIWGVKHKARIVYVWKYIIICFIYPRNSQRYYCFSVVYFSCNNWNTMIDKSESLEYYICPYIFIMCINFNYKISIVEFSILLFIFEEGPSQYLVSILSAIWLMWAIYFAWALTQFSLHNLFLKVHYVYFFNYFISIITFFVLLLTITAHIIFQLLYCGLHWLDRSDL